MQSTSRTHQVASGVVGMFGGGGGCEWQAENTDRGLQRVAFAAGMSPRCQCLGDLQIERTVQLEMGSSPSSEQLLDWLTRETIWRSWHALRSVK